MRRSDVRFLINVIGQFFQSAYTGCMSENINPHSFYAQVGGAPVFEKLCREFYLRVASDPEFKAMYPEDDLGPAERRLRMFLEQYWGGPKTYQIERGHPRLRMRHMPFAIGPQERDMWLGYMREAVDTLNLSPLHEAELWDYLERSAHAMQNRASSAEHPHNPE